MFFRAALDVILPPRCHLCKAFILGAEKIHICPSCGEKCKPITSPLCDTCGVPFLTERGDNHVCGTCITKPPSYAAARAAFLYEGSIRELIHRFKYDHKVQICRPLGHLAAQQLAPFATAMVPDMLIPVPLHHKRLRQRCFNQAVLLCEILGKKWQLPVSRDNLRRIRWTEPQISLSAEERVSNVRGAFEVADPENLSGKRIILVDDVYTTGSTVLECARVL